MQALHFIAPGELEWRDIDEPVLQQPTDALVQPLAVAACDLDRSMVLGGAPFKGPFVLGHEFCGEIVAVGEEVVGLTPGDAVLASFQPSCGDCHACHADHSSVCRSVPPTSMYGVGHIGGDWSGALANLIRVPWASFTLRRLSAQASPTALASASDNLADGLRAVDQPLQHNPGASVLVAGAGSIALYGVLCALYLGSEQVSFASHDQHALAVADALGARCIEVDRWPRKFASHEITLDCTNHVDGLAAVIRSTAPYGDCTSASIYFTPTTPMPLAEMYMKGIRFHTGRVNSASQLDRVLTLADQGLDPLRIQPAVLPMQEADQHLLSPTLSQKLIFEA